jgi:catechol 2,3-dioxygenase-like lactoylglutathione lyase family enzyme
MDVQSIASFSVISRHPEENRRLFVEALGLPLEGLDGDYWHSEKIGGSRHFGVWPLEQAAEACFGTPEWPSDRPVPQASVEFEVESHDAVAAAADELEERGFALLHPSRTEPWGQTVARTLAPDGLIVGISYAPWLHEAAEG